MCRQLDMQYVIYLKGRLFKNSWFLNYLVLTFFSVQNVCLFVIYCPIQNFFPHIETSHLPWKAANLDLRSALMAIEQWRFFSVPHLLWHGTSVYNDHLREHVTLTHIAKRLAVELSLPVFTSKVCRCCDSSKFPLAGPTL